MATANLRKLPHIKIGSKKKYALSWNICRGGNRRNRGVFWWPIPAIAHGRGNKPDGNLVP
jgi:hypothetical protein